MKIYVERCFYVTSCITTITLRCVTHLYVRILYWAIIRFSHQVLKIALKQLVFSARRVCLINCVKIKKPLLQRAFYIDETTHSPYSLCSGIFSSTLTMRTFTSVSFGFIFWLTLKRFVGSYFAFIEASLSKLSA